MDVGGTTRTFIVDVPVGYAPGVPTPILFGFHGMSTSGELFRSQFYGNLLSAFGDDFIVVHPNAEGDPTAWATSGGDDVLFFDALLALLAATYCIDETRVFVTGHSSGGFFTNTLGCQRGEVLRGVGPVSGGGPFTFGGSTCTGQVAAWIAHGNNDETVDFSNGESSRDHWAAANGCDTSQSTVPSPNYPCVEYVGCDPSYPVRWCEYDDGHDWASFAPEAMHDFFSGL